MIRVYAVVGRAVKGVCEEIRRRCTMADMEAKTERLDIRLSPAEKEALRQAAERADRELSDFARRKLLRGLKTEAAK